MQSVSSRIRTRVAVSISYDNNDYTTGTSMNILLITILNAPDLFFLLSDKWFQLFLKRIILFTIFLLFIKGFIVLSIAK